MPKNISRHSVQRKYPILVDFLKKSLDASCGKYQFIDMYGGPGSWILDPYGWVKGSPLQAHSVFENSGREFHMLMIEKDFESYQKLVSNMMRRCPTKSFTVMNADSHEIDTFQKLNFKYKYGFVLCDPESSRFPWQPIIHLAKKVPYYDILIHFSSTNRKRFNDYLDLQELISKIHRKRKYIYGPVPKDSFQWCFLLFTNHDYSPRDFEDIHSEIGQRYLKKANTRKSDEDI